MRTTDPIAPARLSIEQIREADDKIRRYVHRTPLVRSNTLSHQLGAEIFAVNDLSNRIIPLPRCSHFGLNAD